MGLELFNTVSILSLAFTAVNVVVSLVLTWIFARKASRTDQLVVLWLIWDGLIHLTLEAPFVIISLTGTVKDSSSFLSLTWKEYGRADARWLVSDPTVVSLEILTAFLLTPICFVLVYAVIWQRPYRHWLQLVLCTCELYGGWMTFAPEWISGSKNLVTDNWLFLWVYLVFFNGLWVIIPLALMYQSWLALNNVTRRPSSGTSTKSRSAVEPPTPTSNSGGESSPGSGVRKSNSRRRKQY